MMHEAVISAYTAKTIQQDCQVTVQPSEQEAIVTQIVTADCKLPAAVSGQAVTLVLDRDIDVSRGDLFCDHHYPVPIVD